VRSTFRSGRGSELQQGAWKTAYSSTMIGARWAALMNETPLNRLKTWARVLKRDVFALYLAGRDPRVPWYAKALALATAAYALSPIDLIPDFIPILGYLDDVIILPLAILLTVRLIPANVLAELRLQAQQRLANSPPTSRAAAFVIVVVWVAAAVAATAFVLR
jgi:uncharacterized membrane protein YkvA (DUF1232 family)